MKRWMTGLAVLVLSLAGVASAETIFTPDATIGDPAMHLVVSDPVPLSYGLAKFTVTAYSDVNPINVVSACSIDGPVHQVWPHNGSSANPNWDTTIFPADLSGTWKSAWNDYDTHRLCAGSQLYFDLQDNYVGPVETNTGGAAYSGDFVGGGFPARVGMGTLTAGNGSADTFAGTAAKKVMPIVQIVIPRIALVHLTVRTVDDKGNSGHYSRVLVGPAGPVPGDANGDGKVTDLDAAAMMAHWWKTGDATWREGDFNGDHTVGDIDASILAAHWQYGVGAAVPEPSALALLAGIAMMGPLCWLRRRVL